jgi:hypothetical protein
MPHAQPVPRLEMAQQFTGGRLKIGHWWPACSGHPKLTQERAVRSYWREWGLTAVGVGPSPAESATGPMEKRPQRDVGSGPALFREAPSNFKLS